ncbi:H(+)-transporting V0 sector ATPase subunit a [Phlyctochytrium planicorne]|nr:H(+)-transporting V0 sector ATPase subunit a [Phlyctochytrium planicorne]
MAATLFRSEEMSLVQLYIPLEIAQATVAELGELGLIQFRDLNGDVNAFQRTFVNEIRRLDDMERRLRFLKSQIEKEKILAKSATGLPQRPRSHQEIDELEEKLSQHDNRIQQMNTSQETLNKRFLELTELRHVLTEITGFFKAAEARGEDGYNAGYREDAGLLAQRGDEDSEATEEGRSSSHVKLGFVAGVIPRGRLGTFERILFRALRGNLYMNHAEIDEPIRDPTTDELVQKNVFVIFAHGKEILAKIRKICESLGATLYAVDEKADKRNRDLDEVQARIADLKNILDNTSHQRRAELLKAAEFIDSWGITLKKEKAIYHTMNSFNYDQNRKALIAEGWCPTASQNAIRYALRTVTERTGSTISPLLSEMRTVKTPPTYHKTNKFTVGFQEIVDAYGMATYQEVNPGLFTIITFPFLFAVMFGDLGHGIIVVIFAAWMVAYESKLASKKWGEIWDIFFGGRYIILLMGIFSIYTGLIYNDIFSKSMNLFGSMWEFHQDPHSKKYVGQKLPKTYAIGVDPAWNGAENGLMFSNSYKMKMAIVIGVLHMLFGICLNVFNHIHFKRISHIYTETIPQLIYICSIFGYLVIMILYKWNIDWGAEGRGPHTAPGLLNTLIYMFLAPGKVDMPLYPGQGPVQVFLLLLAFVCIPWMLLGTPALTMLEQYYLKDKGYVNLSSENLNTHEPSLEIDRTNVIASPSPTGPSGHEEMHQEVHVDFSEMMVHQVIHTIEFCLSGISNTASYLRLWALSLAHNQLSEVLWEMVMHNALSVPVLRPIAIMIGFAMWFSLTVFILLVMEGLSAFLHALRLHWVEFQSKFYEGAGKKFEPFSFALLLVDTSEE